MASVDAQLLSGKLRQARHAGREPKPEAEEKGLYNSVRESRLAAKRRVGAIKKSSEQKTNAASVATSGILKQAWLNLIPSWFFTLHYINLHVFMHAVFPSFFCRLGEEWIPREIKQSSGGETASKAFTLVETILWLIINLIYFGLLLIAVVMIALIVFMTLGWLTKAGLWVIKSGGLLVGY